MKYIIDLPERYIEKRPDGEEWLQIPINVSGHELMIKTVIPLTPYTEPDLEQVREKAYEDGYKTAKVQCNIQAEKDLREVGKRHYQKGYQDATVKIGSDEQAIAEKAYQRGLDDAWDTARMIVLSKEIGGLFDFDSVKAVFGCGTFLALKKYSASEAIEKVRQYEQEQEQQIQVGDEVEAMAGKAVIIEVLDNGKAVRYMYSDASSGVNASRNVTRTGRCFPEIAEVLKRMQEET